MTREQIQGTNFTVASGANGQAIAVYFDVAAAEGTRVGTGEQKVLLLLRSDAETLLKQLQAALFPERPQGLH